MDGYPQATIRAGLWQGLWELGHQKQIAVYHMTGHASLFSSGNDVANMLAKVQWLEKVLAGLSGTEIAQWLRHYLLHAGRKTMWSTIKAWGLPVTLAGYRKLGKPVLSACESIPRGLWELLGRWYRDRAGGTADPVADRCNQAAT